MLNYNPSVCNIIETHGQGYQFANKYDCIITRGHRLVLASRANCHLTDPVFSDSNLHLV